MKITLIEPFYSGSHKAWAEGLKNYSSHEITILSLNGIHWKWRMHGAAITLYQKLKKQEELPDLILVTDMLDLALFKAQMSVEELSIPIVIFFHENQLTYPWSKTDADVSRNRNRHYGFINYSSALIADKVLFNSNYHMNSFLTELPQFLSAFPDFQNMFTVKQIEQKSEVIHLGLELQRFTQLDKRQKSDSPVILWNHRWEYDKNPDLFFNSLFRLKVEGHKFQLIVLGESYKNSPDIFEISKNKLKEEIIHWGFAETKEEYIQLLKSADILPITSNQDFFGISIAEAIASGAYPLLPNRLSFPELVLNKSCFYDSDEEFYHHLKELIIHETDELINEKLKDHILSFDWEFMIYEYDNCFSNLLTFFGNKLDKKHF